MLALPHRPHVAHPGRGHQQPHARVAHPERAPAAPAPRPGRGRGRRRRPSRRSARSASGPPAPSTLVGVGGERLAERVDALGLAAPGPAAARWPPKLLQVLGAGLERRPAGRSRGCCAPSRARRPRRRARSRPPAGGGARPAARRRSRPRPGCQPSPARTSAGASRSSSGSSRRAASAAVDHLPLGRPPLAVGPAQLGGDLRRPRRRPRSGTARPRRRPGRAAPRR